MLYSARGALLPMISTVSVSFEEIPGRRNPAGALPALWRADSFVRRVMMRLKGLNDSFTQKEKADLRDRGIKSSHMPYKQKQARPEREARLRANVAAAVASAAQIFQQTSLRT